MKIGIDARLWNETGIGRYIRNLIFQLKNIDKQNEYILFVKKNDYHNLKDFFSKQNERWKVVIADIPWHSFSEQISFPKILNSSFCDLIHFPYPSVPIWYKRPYIVTIHDLIPLLYSTGKASTLPYFLYYAKRFAFNFILKKASRNAKAIITVSYATKKDLTNYLHIPKDKIYVTYEGIDPRITAVTFPKTANPMKYFLYVGNAYPHKNIKNLLLAYKIIVNKYSNIKLMMVGKPDHFYYQLKKEIKDLFLEKNVIIKENISDDELGLLYREALALIVPSFIEGFGLPAIEAMSNKCLVIASKIPSLMEICKDAAVYINPHDINDIANIMIHVILYPNLYDEKRLYGKLVAKEYSWKNMAEKTLRIYESSVSI